MPDKIDKLLERAASADVAELMAIWRAREPEEWSQSSEAYRVLGERILAQGEPLLAYDVVHEGLTKFSADIRLRQLRGLALARSGAAERASAIFERLCADGQTDEETLGMLAGTYKDLAAQTPTAKREKFLKRAAKIYMEAYKANGGYWTGINAATMNLLIGQKKRASAIARKVREQCLKGVRSLKGDQFWELAALGEAALVCRDFVEAKKWYARAAENGKNRFGDWHSSRRNARLILEYWNEDPGWIDKYLRVPSVIVFGGHMIDRPGRVAARFPPEIEGEVARQIRRQIRTLKPGSGFSSAACGSDILFLEAMLGIGAEISVLLPYNQEQFVRDSVDFIPNSSWRARFDNVLSRASRIIAVSAQSLEIGGVSFEFCNRILLGLATIRARQLDTQVTALAVWNELAGDGPGGAAHVVQTWRSLGLEPQIVNPSSVMSKTITNPRKAERSRTTRSMEPRRSEVIARPAASDEQFFSSRIAAMLFADAVGFSKLTEAEVPLFVEHFLGTIARLTWKFRRGIIGKNTWGDGLYFVFSEVDPAGRFALDVADLIAATKWEEKGLRAGLNLRIALHAGPVYEFDDPITGSRSYSGRHVSRAARLEPITPPGQVYASESFAALAAAEQANGFTCDYVGQTPMAKGYGTLPTYHVRRCLSTS